MKRNCQLIEPAEDSEVASTMSLDDLILSDVKPYELNYKNVSIIILVMPFEQSMNIEDGVLIDGKMYTCFDIDSRENEQRDIVSLIATV